MAFFSPNPTPLCKTRQSDDYWCFIDVCWNIITILLSDVAKDRVVFIWLLMDLTHSSFS